MTQFHNIFKIFRGDRNTWILIFAFIVLAGIADFSISFLLTRQYRNEQKVSITLELATARARLEEHIGKNLSLIYGMGAHISIRPDVDHDEFSALAQVLMKRGSSLKNIAAAPDFVIQYVYPLEGNRKIIGLDYRKMPDQWDRALAAKETGQIAVAGPINLFQGGHGLIVRVPVYKNTDGSFWGLVSSVIDLDILMQQIKFEKIGIRMDLAIRGKDGQGAQGDTFWGDSALFDVDVGAVLMSVVLPTGSWQMAAVPQNGWANNSPYDWLVHLFVFLIALFGGMIAIQRNRSTQVLIENEKRLKAMSEASHDALIMIDSDDIISFWNPSAETMFGFQESEVIGKKLHEIIILPDEMEKSSCRTRKVFSNGPWSGGWHYFGIGGNS